MTILCHLFAPSLVMHGHTNSMLSKNMFFIFYLSGILYMVFRWKFSVYILLLIRRLIECYLFRYRRSRMNILQFIVGISYYIILSDHIMNHDLKLTFPFLCLNMLQFIAHYFVFKRKYTLIHYITELLIYFYIFLQIRTFVLFLNLLWIITFIMITLSTRRFFSRRVSRKHRK